MTAPRVYIVSQAGVTRPDEEEPQQPTILTPRQEQILEALKGKSLSMTKLAKACKCHRTVLYKPSALPALLESGQVVRYRSSYTRPDFPPK